MLQIYLLCVYTKNVRLIVNLFHHPDNSKLAIEFNTEDETVERIDGDIKEKRERNNGTKEKCQKR